MPKRKAKKDGGRATLAAVKKEMDEPRMAKSTRSDKVNFVAAPTVTAKRVKSKA